ncbi:MAG: hypothetical protein IJO51_00135, partial [Clostridia bacterium]|nr:hypothetical protein [Clostridia bacterium]
MKKLSALLALLLSMALLAGCHTDAPEKPETNDTPDTPEQEQTETVVDPEPDTEPEAVETPVFDEKTLPLLDGSTATIPLSEGIVQALLGYDAAEAQAFVK